LVREEYIATYEKASPPPERESDNTSDKASNVGKMSEFANISIDPKSATKLSEIDEYLRLPVENVADPLKWWYDNRRVYPNLSRMALDYLSIPGTYFYFIFLIGLITGLATSTAVERVFSKGRHLLHFTRNRLSPSSIRAYLCLGSWARKGLLSVDDFLNGIKGKSAKRKREDSEIDSIA
jgi:hypothetical protein